jgi:hypothetical protein
VTVPPRWTTEALHVSARPDSGCDGRATFTSEAIEVTVANDLSGPARVLTDYEAGRIDVDGFSLYGMFSLLVTQAAPERYRSDTPFSGEGAGVAAYFLGNSIDLTRETQGLLTALMESPWHGAAYDGPACPPVPPPGWP